MPVLSIGMGILQAVSGYSAAQAEYKAREQQYAANLENAKTATYDRFDAIQTRAVQENAAASQQLQENSVEALRARSSARVAAAESGISGGAVSSMIRDILGKESRFASATLANADYTKDYLASEQRAAAAQGQNQVNSVQRIAKPSFLPYALQAFGQGLSVFDKNREAFA